MDLLRIIFTVIATIGATALISATLIWIAISWATSHNEEKDEDY